MSIYAGRNIALGTFIDSITANTIIVAPASQTNTTTPFTGYYISNANNFVVLNTNGTNITTSDNPPLAVGMHVIVNGGSLGIGGTTTPLRIVARIDPNNWTLTSSAFGLPSAAYTTAILPYTITFPLPDVVYVIPSYIYNTPTYIYLDNTASSFTPSVVTIRQVNTNSSTSTLRSSTIIYTSGGGSSLIGAFAIFEGTSSSPVGTITFYTTGGFSLSSRTYFAIPSNLARNPNRYGWFGG
jgi:hypothetical protein